MWEDTPDHGYQFDLLIKQFQQEPVLATYPRSGNDWHTRIHSFEDRCWQFLLLGIAIAFGTLICNNLEANLSTKESSGKTDKCIEEEPMIEQVCWCKQHRQCRSSLDFVRLLTSSHPCRPSRRGLGNDDNWLDNRRAVWGAAVLKWWSCSICNERVEDSRRKMTNSFMKTDHFHSPSKMEAVAKPRRDNRTYR